MRETQRPRRRRAYKPPAYSPPNPTPRCPDCGGRTFLSSTRRDGQGDGIYFRCEDNEEHEQFVRLDGLDRVMAREYARQGADMPDARKREFAQAAQVTVDAVKSAKGRIAELKRPLAEMEEYVGEPDAIVDIDDPAAFNTYREAAAAGHEHILVKTDADLWAFQIGDAVMRIIPNPDEDQREEVPVVTAYGIVAQAPEGGSVVVLFNRAGAGRVPLAELEGISTDALMAIWRQEQQRLPSRAHLARLRAGQPQEEVW